MPNQPAPEPWLAVFLLLAPLVVGVIEWFRSKTDHSVLTAGADPDEVAAPINSPIRR